MPPKRKASKAKATAEADAESYSPPLPRKARLVHLPLAKTLTLDAAQEGVELLASAERDTVPLASLLTALKLLLPIVEVAERAYRQKRCCASGCASTEPAFKCECSDAMFCAPCAEKHRCECGYGCDDDGFWCRKCRGMCEFCKSTRFAKSCLSVKKCGKTIAIATIVSESGERSGKLQRTMLLQ